MLVLNTERQEVKQMIINKDWYKCPQCGEFYLFETSKEYKSVCPECNCNLIFIDNVDCDTELAEKVKNTPPYDPTLDPNSPYYIPVVKCPYCQSTDTSRISAVSRIVSTGLFGFGSKKVGKQWHCNKCKSDF